MTWLLLLALVSAAFIAAVLKILGVELKSQRARTKKSSLKRGDSFAGAIPAAQGSNRAGASSRLVLTIVVTALIFATAVALGAAWLNGVIQKALQ